MTIRDQVLNIMSDGEPRTITEIARIIAKDNPGYEMSDSLKAQVRCAVMICRKWGQLAEITDETTSTKIWVTA